MLCLQGNWLPLWTICEPSGLNSGDQLRRAAAWSRARESRPNPHRHHRPSRGLGDLNGDRHRMAQARVGEDRSDSGGVEFLNRVAIVICDVKIVVSIKGDTIRAI